MLNLTYADLTAYHLADLLAGHTFTQDERTYTLELTVDLLPVSLQYDLMRDGTLLHAQVYDQAFREPVLRFARLRLMEYLIHIGVVTEQELAAEQDDWG